MIDVENGGLFGVRLGQTERQIRQKLGLPDDIFRDRTRREIEWSYQRRLNLEVFFKTGTRRVTYLDAQDPRAKTAASCSFSCPW